MALKPLFPFRVLLPIIFSLFLLVGLAQAPDALARNNYELRESGEGDPGDGVLKPAPDVIDPNPDLTPRLFVTAFSADGPFLVPGNRPIIILPSLFQGQILAYGLLPWTGLADHQFPWPASDGRWTHAP